tara:strand:+ start:337 stop:558 length:222 start_codon:yes stop_codon:yes gene_type:complete
MGMPLEVIKEQFMNREKANTENKKPKRQNSNTKLTSSLRKGKPMLEPYSPDTIKKMHLGQKTVKFESKKSFEI